MSGETTSTDVLADRVLVEVATELRSVLRDTDPDGPRITRDTLFHDDLRLESIDLVQLAAALQDRYQGRVNFAEFVAGLDLDELIDLTVGGLVDHVVVSLRGRT